MKAGGTTKSRYDKLKPAVEQAFDLPGMTALSVGPSWASASRRRPEGADRRLRAHDHRQLRAQFRFLSAARNSPSIRRSTERGTDKFVKSTLKPSSGDAIAFNYRLHQADGSWKIVDVYLAGNISQLAQKRSDFAATLAASGPQGLAKKINALADQMLG